MRSLTHVCFVCFVCFCYKCLRHMCALFFYLTRGLLQAVTQDGDTLRYAAPSLQADAAVVRLRTANLKRCCSIDFRHGTFGSFGVISKECAKMVLALIVARGKLP